MCAFSSPTNTRPASRARSVFFRGGSSSKRTTKRVLAESSSRPVSPANCAMPEAEAQARFSLDLWLGGRLTLAQPKAGHRVGSDAALLAAALDLADGPVVDVGAGVGAVGLALALRSERVKIDLVEIDPGLARLAGDNAARNGLADRVRALSLDVMDGRARGDAGLMDNSAARVGARFSRCGARAGACAPRRRFRRRSADRLAARVSCAPPAGRTFRHDPPPRGSKDDP